MNVPVKALNEVTHDAITVLAREIGMADTIRFLNQFAPGQGNYTEERDALFGSLTLNDILPHLRTDQPAA